MRISATLFLLLLNISAGYCQFVDSLFLKLEDETMLNSSLSDGDDLYLTFENYINGRYSLWLFNDMNESGKELFFVKGSGWGSQSFKKDGFIYMVFSGQKQEYSTIIKIKQGVIQSIDSVRLMNYVLSWGGSYVYFGGIHDSLGYGIASYNLTTKEKHYFQTPSKPHLKSVVFDTVIFSLQDGTELYSGFEGRGFKEIFACDNTPPLISSILKTEAILSIIMHSIQRTDQR